MSETYNYIYYGTKTKAGELRDFVEHILDTNLRGEAEGKRPSPVCIWGRHGIGKTEMVEAISKENNYKFTYIAPAQFEEMGDLVGMPSIEKDKTVFKIPDWVPTEEGPGVLLIDDVNRADDRILRGIMQLLQNFELVSWKLPPQWQIVLTANPDGGDYSVTPMDDAMLTRMMHITLEFDVKEWAKWAEKSGVDERGINFLLTYPEIVSGNRTTPRTLVQFFNAISSIKDLSKELPLVRILADSCLDSPTVTSFISFVNNNLGKLITPQQIVEADNFKRQVHNVIKAVVVKKTLRVDIIATICTRLINYLTFAEKKPNKHQINNIKQFIKLDFLPNDIRLTLAQDIVKMKHLKTIMGDPEIGMLLLGKM